MVFGYGMIVFLVVFGGGTGGSFLRVEFVSFVFSFVCFMSFIVSYYEVGGVTLSFA